MTTGGVYVITELARHLAAAAEVTLVVGKGQRRPIPGVRVIPANGLDPEALPDADVLIGGLAQGTVDQVLGLPARVGTPVFLFMGYGEPGSTAVRLALARRPRVLTIAEFLAADARRAGCAVEPIAVGLDRGLFAPGREASARQPLVAMISHKTDWKGTADGAEALREVRAACPQAEVVYFGEPRDDIPGRLAEQLSGHRDRIGALLGRTAVFVLPSWEEGLGLPGIEALACGAALATTDTRGGRDYAQHEVTALVSPPRHPAALARNVVRLLRDRELRGSLASAGQRFVLDRYPAWPQAATRFRRAVERLAAMPNG